MSGEITQHQEGNGRQQMIESNRRVTNLLRKEVNVMGVRGEQSTRQRVEMMGWKTINYSFPQNMLMKKKGL